MAKDLIARSPEVRAWLAARWRRLPLENGRAGSKMAASAWKWLRRLGKNHISFNLFRLMSPVGRRAASPLGASPCEFHLRHAAPTR